MVIDHPSHYQHDLKLNLIEKGFMIKNEIEAEELSSPKSLGM